MAAGFSQWGNDLHTGRRSYNVVGARRRFYLASAIMVLLALVVLLTRGFNLGIEFRGGSEFTVDGVVTQNQEIAADAVASIAPNEVPRISTLGDSAIRVQTAELTEAQVGDVRVALADAYEVASTQVTSSFIGPSWGKDVSQKAITGLIVFLVLVAIVMTLYFRAWRMALAAILALFHDLIITAGVYAAIGWEVTPATVIGFLTILGYSIYDTVVVFDKVRENTDDVLDQSRTTYAEQANLAVNQTLVRSINTSIVALLPVASILFIGAFILGAGTLRDISLALFVGMGVGTYSSIFLATPLEVTLRQREAKTAAHTAKILEARSAVVVTDETGASTTTALAFTGHLQPGAHQGHQAQPRKRKSGR
ncbi:protein translocase subunit SecF [Sanguibacter antarcticus]|uniref:Protein-export membrane protein SecF n=1 Tax=Sanguibacter antarcticus TaxID=372484 RepID=A0A2A9E3C1_9MICO|nr:protein translocase subunit SecF [Sanguibacter antarcticus]PFG33071.1 protein translocase subunit secF [Sanguibacter antarcticus]